MELHPDDKIPPPPPRHDELPFPMQRSGPVGQACPIPTWLAKLAHKTYAERHDRSFGEIAGRGGFTRAELVAFIRGSWTTGGIATALADLEKLDNAT